MENVTRDSLKKKHGEKAGDAFTEIAALGGYGDVGADAILDLRGALDPENKAVSTANKNRIKELTGESGAKEPVEKK